MEREDFLSYLLDPLGGERPVEARRMFGGYGLCRGGLFVAIVMDGTLYVKEDDESRATFEDAELPRFSYWRRGKQCSLSYYRVPDEAIDSMDELARWTQMGCEAALRARRRQPRRGS